MKPKEKEEEMQRFVRGETQILVATTVIEVGVNVPNASVMVILDAQRFGLSQLHQLRGRVGRGADQSYCILVTSYKLSEETRKRIDIMCATCYPGFEQFLDGAEYTADLFTVSGNITTGEGPAAALPYGYELLRQLKGEEIVAQLEEGMRYCHLLNK